LAAGRARPSRFQVVGEDLGEDGVVAGQAALFEGHVLAEIAGLLAESHAAALHHAGTDAAAAGIAGALLSIELLGGAFDFAAVLGGDGALALVGVMADDGLLEEGRADDGTQEGFIDGELPDFLSLDIENWHFNHGFISS